MTTDIVKPSPNNFAKYKTPIDITIPPKAGNIEIIFK